MWLLGWAYASRLKKGGFDRIHKMGRMNRTEKILWILRIMSILSLRPRDTIIDPLDATAGSDRAQGPMP